MGKPQIPDRRSKGLCSLSAQGLVLALSVATCAEPPSSEREVETTQFSHAELGFLELHGEVINDSPALGQPSALALAGSTLWIKDAMGDPGLHVLDAKTGELLHSLGRRGEGPGEFSSNPFGIEPVHPDSAAIWAFDLSLQRLTRFDLRPSRGDEIRTVRLQGPPQVLRVTWLNSDLILGMALSEQQRFVVFDSAGQKIRAFPGPLLGPDTIPTEARLTASTTAARICSRGEDRGFIIAYFGAGQVEYYDAEGRLETRAAVPYPSELTFLKDPDTGEIKRSSPRRWYVDCASSNRLVFALFSGRRFDSYLGSDSSEGEFIHVFGQDGRLLRVLHLDHGASGIAVGEDGRRLFTASLSDAAIRQYAVTEGVVEGPPGDQG